MTKEEFIIAQKDERENILQSILDSKEQKKKLLLEREQGKLSHLAKY